MLGRTTPLTVVGPKNLEALVTNTLALSGSHLTYELNFIELEAPSTHQTVNGELPDHAHDDAGLEQHLADLAAATPTETELKGRAEAYAVEQMKLDTQLSVLTEQIGCVIRAFPLQHCMPAFGFNVKTFDRRGRLQAAKAMALGAKHQNLALLAAGKDITLENGTTISSAEVVGPIQKGLSVLLLQDTSDSQYAVDACRGDCDVLIHEATYDKALEAKALYRGHSTSATAGRVAAILGAPLLLLTHFSARYKATRKKIKRTPQVSEVLTGKQLKVPAKPPKKQVLSVYDLCQEALEAGLTHHNLDHKTQAVKSSANSDADADVDAASSKSWQERYAVYAAHDFMVLERIPKTDDFAVKPVDESYGIPM
jgi:ribonuclease BN (tRNA processing enzyme)